jgi:predicted 2-oxoglutarate/Fe(II)-dependent dioxygenase YbiX
VRAVNEFVVRAFSMLRQAEAEATATATATRETRATEDEDWASMYPSFCASRYTKGHKIDPHDDAAYAPVALADGGFEMRLRAYAAVYYLTPDDWDVERDGGAFVDMHDDTAPGVVIEPKFNRLVVFKVPRVHAVAAVTSKRRRHAIFGWFYRPAREDELSSSDANDERSSDADACRSNRRGRGERDD